jgi:hypothetical protein
MRDTRKQRNMLILALGAGLGAVLTEQFVKPLIEGMVKK